MFNLSCFAAQTQQQQRLLTTYNESDERQTKLEITGKYEDTHLDTSSISEGIFTDRILISTSFNRGDAQSQRAASDGEEQETHHYPRSTALNQHPSQESLNSLSAEQKSADDVFQTIHSCFYLTH